MDTKQPKAPNRHYEVHPVNPKDVFEEKVLRAKPGLEMVRWCADPDMSSETLYYYGGRWVDYMDLLEYAV